MNQPLITVIMPAYNAAAYIGEAIESIINQSYTNWELLIGDDVSKDNTKEIVGKYLQDSRIKLICNTENSGSPITCNRLLALGKGDYMTLLDSDDICPPERLQLQLNAFLDNPNLGLVGTAYNIVDMEGNLIEKIQKPLSYKEIQETLKHKNAFCGATMMVSRAAYEEIGGYREFFRYYAYHDYDWAYCIADKFESINLPQALYNYRQNPQSNSKKILPKRYIADKIVQYLGKQRAEQGQDDLQKGNMVNLNNFVESLLAPYEEDPSLIYRKYAENFMYIRFHKAAISSAWEGIKKAPSKLVNYRTLFYCLRKTARAKINL